MAWSGGPCKRAPTRAKYLLFWAQKMFFSIRNENWEVSIGYVANMKYTDTCAVQLECLKRLKPL